MLIAIGNNLQKGAYGGGNQFVSSLEKFLLKEKIELVYSLKHNNIDLILLTSTRPWTSSCSIDPIAAFHYINKHPATKIVLRVNECDERKNKKPKLLNLLTAKVAQKTNQTVFVSHWLKSLYCKTFPQLKNKLVIQSGADPMFFNTSKLKRWNNHEPLKIVTHHWSNNWYKGWDVYQQIDKLK